MVNIFGFHAHAICHIVSPLHIPVLLPPFHSLSKSFKTFFLKKKHIFIVQAVQKRGHGCIWPTVCGFLNPVLRGK